MAELCKWPFYGQRRSFGPVLFAKKAFYIHKDSPEAKNTKKNEQKPSKKGVFPAPPTSWLSFSQNELAHLGKNWTGSFKDKPSLDPGKLSHVRTNQLVWSQTWFVLKWASSPGSKLVLSLNEPARLGPNSWLEGLEKNTFFGGVCLFFVLFFASGPSLCTWHGYFEKKTGPACFL